MAGHWAGQEYTPVAGGTGHAGRLAGGPEVSGRAARHHRRAAHLESDPGAASASPLFSDRWWADAGWPLAGRPQRVSAARTRGHGRVSGQDAQRPPVGLGPGRAGAPGGDASSAAAQSAQPLRPSEEDALAWVHDGTLGPWGWGGDVSRPLSAGRS